MENNWNRKYVEEIQFKGKENFKIGKCRYQRLPSLLPLHPFKEEKIHFYNCRGSRGHLGMRNL